MTDKGDERKLPAIQPETRENPVTMVYIPRRVEVYSIVESELDTLSSSFNSVHLGFFGLAFGAAVTLAITLVTVNTLSDRIFAAFIAATIVSVAASAYFGIQAIRDWREGGKVEKRIRRRPAHPAQQAPDTVDSPPL